ncbi:MAG: ATP-dependent helicase HrpB [Lentisphaeria bacterium]|nr:ATP-dependent helicase HrpB [Lentisphaeria bacterium]
MNDTPQIFDPDRYPVCTVFPELLTAWRQQGRVVLVSPPGSGKTTLVPPFLLHRDEPGRILVLEPRRVAARAAASRIATLLQDTVGGLAGYRVRGESAVSAKTRIEIITDGILTRMLQQDPELPGVSGVIFDEFHERHLESDLGLALLLDLRESLRPDLRVMIMSATLDGDRLSRLLDDAPVVTAAGRVWPVERHHLETSPDCREVGPRAARVVRGLLARETGSILVFLPGVREIEQAAAALADLASPAVQIMPLYGQLDKRAQDAAIEPAPDGVRKVVLATNVAESSITIEGVRIVVDSGFERAIRFDPGRSLPTLAARRISKASAEQRAGRAGRTGPGAVYRLYDEAVFRAMMDFAPPEIRTADLAPLAQELAQWGAEAESLRWLDPPAPAALQAGRRLLTDLRLFDTGGRPTAAGREAARLGIHPRLGAMMLLAAKLDLVPLAAELAALLEERGGSQDSADIRDRLTAWRREPHRFHHAVVVRDQLLRLMKTRYREQSDAAAGRLLAAAFPDRIGQARRAGGNDYLMTGGAGASLAAGDPLGKAPYLAVAEWEGGRIRLAAPVAREDLEEMFAGAFTEADTVIWENDRVVARRERRLGALVWRSTPLAVPDPAAAAALLAGAIRDHGGALPGLSPAAGNLLTRVRFAAREEPGEWPDWSEEGMAAALPDLLMFLPEARSLADLRRADWVRVLSAALGGTMLARLDRDYPERFTTPAGTHLRIDYRGDVPVLPVKVQEMFGVKVHPVFGRSRRPLRIELLSPALRTVQITSDLPRFWQENYRLVQKEMKARYPKHFWPDDPAGQTATSRTVKRREPGR